MNYTQTIESKTADIVKANADNLKATITRYYESKKTDIENKIKNIECQIEKMRTNYAIALSDPSVIYHSNDSFECMTGSFITLKKYEDELSALNEAYKAFNN